MSEGFVNECNGAFVSTDDRIRFEMDVDRTRFLANLETRPRKGTPTGKEVSKMACGGKKGGKCCGGKKCGGKKGK